MEGQTRRNSKTAIRPINVEYVWYDYIEFYILRKGTN